jgi:hypothetical protein
MINSKNTIVISTTIPKNITSEARRNNLINNFSKWNIPLVFNDYIKKKKEIHEISYEMIVNNFNLFKNTNFEYAIICDDDFFPIDNFLEELNETVNLLPYNWRCLHLCPGYLWGRRFRNKDKIGLLNAEYNMTGIQYHESGRFYLNCTGDTYFNKKFFLGGPIAIVINKNNFESLLHDFVFQYEKSNLPNDVILTKILNANDYICREPQLGYEEQEGGTTFN